MMLFSNRRLERIYSFVLLGVVLLSWAYVIYGTRVAADWLLQQRAAALRD